MKQQNKKKNEKLLSNDDIKKMTIKKMTIKMITMKQQNKKKNEKLVRLNSNCVRVKGTNQTYML